MTLEEKQLELNRHRNLLLTTIDYLVSIVGSSLVLDAEDIPAKYYEQQKLQVEKYYRQRRLDKLRQRFVGLTTGLQSRVDLQFAAYIKEKTGYDINIFEEMAKRVEVIIAQNEIRGQKEFDDVSIMLRFYQQTSVDKALIDKLRALLGDYHKRVNKPHMSATGAKRKSRYTEVISKVKKDCIEVMTVSFSTAAKPKHMLEQEAISPDGKRRLLVTQYSNGRSASTSVTVVFPTASGGVYAADGICADVKASWKDNSTIVVEAKKDYNANVQYKKVQSFDDVITIEYIEC